MCSSDLSTSSLVDDLCFAGVLSAAQDAADAVNDPKTANRLERLENRLGCGGMPDDSDESEEDDETDVAPLIEQVALALDGANLTQLWELSTIPRAAEEIVASAGGLRLVVDACSPAPSPAAEGASRRVIAMETLANLAVPTHLRLALVQGGAPLLISRALRDSMQRGMDDDHALALRRHAVAAALLLASSPSLAHQLCFAGVLATARDALSAENNDPKTADRLKLLEKRLGC